MTDFSSPQKLYLVLIPRNRYQRVASTVTRLLVYMSSAAPSDILCIFGGVDEAAVAVGLLRVHNQ